MPVGRRRKDTPFIPISYISTIPFAYPISPLLYALVTLCNAHRTAFVCHPWNCPSAPEKPVCGRKKAVFDFCGTRKRLRRGLAFLRISPPGLERVRAEKVQLSGMIPNSRNKTLEFRCVCPVFERLLQGRKSQFLSEFLEHGDTFCGYFCVICLI